MYTRSRIRDLACIRLSCLDLIRIFCTHIMKNSYSTSASSERNVDIVQKSAKRTYRLLDTHSVQLRSGYYYDEFVITYLL